MSRTRYTTEQQAEAIRIYQEHGARAAAKAIGCGHGTVSRWVQAAGASAGTSRIEKTRAAIAQNRAQGELTRAQVRNQFLDVAQYALTLAREPYDTHVGQHAKPVTYDHPPAQDIRNLVLAAAVALDKVRLEDGEATDRREHVSQSEFDREVADLVNRVRGGHSGRNGSTRTTT